MTTVSIFFVNSAWIIRNYWSRINIDISISESMEESSLLHSMDRAETLLSLDGKVILCTVEQHLFLNNGKRGKLIRFPVSSAAWRLTECQEPHCHLSIWISIVSSSMSSYSSLFLASSLLLVVWLNVCVRCWLNYHSSNVNDCCFWLSYVNAVCYSSIDTLTNFALTVLL